MNRTVGFPASIGAQMILSGNVEAKGVLSPAKHVPVETFLAELEKREMHFRSVQLRTTTNGNDRRRLRSGLRRGPATADEDYDDDCDQGT